MPKEVQMAFRIEPNLRAEFAEATAQAYRPAAQVLRELMRAYVNQSREHGHSAANDLISPEESRRRQKAMDFARASMALEGFEAYKEDEELTRRYVAGEITIADAIKAVDESIRTR